MKILDAGTKQLTNAEMLDHIHERRAIWAEREAKARAEKRTVHLPPPNVTKVLDNVESRLTRTDAPTPIAGDTKYDAATAIPLLCQRLKPYRLTKPEMLQIFNLRPWKLTQMTLIIEDFETRFNEAQQHKIVTTIYEVLGGEDHPFADEVEAEAGAEDFGEAMDGV